MRQKNMITTLEPSCRVSPLFPLVEPPPRYDSLFQYLTTYLLAGCSTFGKPLVTHDQYSVDLETGNWNQNHVATRECSDGQEWPN